MARVADVIRGWLGWCPNGNAMTAKSCGRTGISTRAENPAKNPAPPGTDGSGMPWRGKYEHTQRASVIIWSAAAVIVTLLLTIFLFGPEWITVLVLGIMAFMLGVASTLTVSVDKKILHIRFGPVGLIRKSWPLAEIVSVTTVTNPWYYGYGLRITPQGPLYNVSGPHAVEVRLMSGKAFRIGTDEPYALKEAIDLARSAKGTPMAREYA